MLWPHRRLDPAPAPLPHIPAAPPKKRNKTRRGFAFDNDKTLKFFVHYIYPTPIPPLPHPTNIYFFWGFFYKKNILKLGARPPAVRPTRPNFNIIFFYKKNLKKIKCWGGGGGWGENYSKKCVKLNEID